MDEIEKAEIELGILQADKEQLKTTEEVMWKYWEWLKSNDYISKIYNKLILWFTI